MLSSQTHSLKIFPPILGSSFCPWYCHLMYFYKLYIAFVYDFISKEPFYQIQGYKIYLYIFFQL